MRKTALVNASGVNEVKQEVDEGNEALQVEVDVSVLQELENSYVGVLAINVEVRRIKTTLYMEGLTHIMVMDMGRNMVLLYSPKSGELESLCKAKA
ncbi:hypothetical protein A2U01_0057498, partial [Trifolium medium]|nr:hypothetical protein [Trifolium medium]